MGCGGACGGNCNCSTRTAADPRRFGLKANDTNILTAARALMMEDPAGIIVVLREVDFKALLDEIDGRRADAGPETGGCDCK